MIDVNTAAEGFDQKNSDVKAIAIADKVMLAMGGRKAYDATKILKWNFFGSRKHIWNKHTGDVVIESEKDNYTMKMNIHDMSGEVFMNGENMTEPDSLKKYLEKGKNMWINDSYWLVMPYKLKDTGVRLYYVGEEITDTTNFDILELRFNGVGNTPQNKYQVYVDKDTELIEKWAFYREAQDTVAAFVTPFTGYKKYGNILLSGDRGNYQLTEIGVE